MRTRVLRRARTAHPADRPNRELRALRSRAHAGRLRVLERRPIFPMLSWESSITHGSWLLSPRGKYVGNECSPDSRFCCGRTLGSSVAARQGSAACRWTLRAKSGGNVRTLNPRLTVRRPARYQRCTGNAGVTTGGGTKK